jgi:hypothetical protein
MVGGLWFTVYEEARHSITGITRGGVRGKIGVSG